MTHPEAVNITHERFVLAPSRQTILHHLLLVSHAPTPALAQQTFDLSTVACRLLSGSQQGWAVANQTTVA